MLQTRSRSTLVLILLVMMLLGAVAAVQAQCEGRCEAVSFAYVENCTLVFESYIPEGEILGKSETSVVLAKPAAAPVTIYVKLFDNINFITEQAVTGEPGTPYTLYFPLTQFFEDEDVSFIVASDPGDSFGFIYWFESLGGEGDVISVPDAVVTACQSTSVNCAYPHIGDVQGTVLGSPITYYEPSLNAETIPPVVLRPNQSWWIVDARDGFYEVFITCGAPLVWVTADALGPNFDAVWQGRPLPDAGTAK